jgi:hypothetical protein
MMPLTHIHKEGGGGAGARRIGEVRDKGMTTKAHSVGTPEVCYG